MMIDLTYFRAAGVSFKNDDGSSRQEYISQLQEYDPLGIKSYEYQGETALHIMDERGHCIGNVPKDQIEFILKHYEAGHKIHLHVNEILGLDEDGQKIDGYHLGVDVAVEVYDDSEEAKPAEAAAAPAAAPPQEGGRKKSGHVMIGFGVFFTIGFITTFNPAFLIIAAALLFFGIRRNKAYKAAAK